MLVFGLIAITAFFTWLIRWFGGENDCNPVKEIINYSFPVFGKVCIIHFILTILATLFFEKTEGQTIVLQIFGTMLFLGLWFFAAGVHSDKNSK